MLLCFVSSFLLYFTTTPLCFYFFFFFFNDTATTEIYTLSLHDALPIPLRHRQRKMQPFRWHSPKARSEEHTSELQSRVELVCRLLLEKKKKGVVGPVDGEKKKSREETTSELIHK